MSDVKAAGAPAEELESQKVKESEDDRCLQDVLTSSKSAESAQPLVEYLYRHYYEKIKAVAEGRLKSNRAVNGEDVFQAVAYDFCKSYEKIPVENFGEAYLFRAVVNYCNRLYRKSKRMDFVEDESSFENLSADNSDEENVQELKEKVNKFLITLSVEQRTVFRLFVLEEYCHEAIAERMGITEQKSRKLLFRARKKIPDWLTSRIF